MKRERKRSETNGIAKVKNGAKDPPPSAITGPDPNKSRIVRANAQRERQNLVLWRHPIRTVHNFLLELALTVRDYGCKLLSHRRFLGVVTFLTFVLLAVYHSNGPHQVC